MFKIYFCWFGTEFQTRFLPANGGTSPHFVNSGMLSTYDNKSVYDDVPSRVSIPCRLYAIHLFTEGYINNASSVLLEFVYAAQLGRQAIRRLHFTLLRPAPPIAVATEVALDCRPCDPRIDWNDKRGLWQ